MTCVRPLAVSLAPHPTRQIVGAREVGHLHQYRCIESWRAAGLDVFSVNAVDEVDAVRAAYPDVPVVVAQRDMRELCGRPLIPVSEMIRALRATGVTWGGVASADVRVAEPRLVRRLVDAGRAAIILNRADVAHPCDGVGVADPDSPAAILFDVERAAALELDPFTVGLPGWGSALATALLLDAAEAVCPSDAVLLHLAHPDEWGEDLHRYLFDAFRALFSSAFAALQRTDRAAALPSLAAIAGAERLADSYANLAERHTQASDLERAARRHRLAYAAAVADLIRELSKPLAETQFRS